MSYRNKKVNKIAKELKNLKSVPDLYNTDFQERNKFIRSRSVTSAINRYKYNFFKTSDKEICATPINLKGSEACSDVRSSDYRYTNGGNTYQDAVDLTKAIKKKLKF